MERMESFIIKSFGKLSKQQKALFISVFAAGLISHGYMLVNNISYHDAILMTDGLGATFNLGRWSLGILEIIGKNTIGIYGIPLFHGILSLIFIALSGMLIVKRLKIRHTLSAVYIGVMMAVFPVVTSIFAFIYTSTAYWLALFLNALVVSVIANEQSIKRLLLGGFLLAFALGLYQAYFGVAVTLFVLLLITDLLDNPSVPCKEIIIQGIWYLITLVTGLVFYLVLNRIIVTVGKIGLSSYQGMNEVGKIEVGKIPHLIINTYHYFLHDIEWSGINSIPLLKVIIIGIFVFSLSLFLFLILKPAGTLVNKLLVVALVLIFPIGVNTVYLMSSNDSYFVHTLMRYSLVLSFVLPILFLEHTHLLQIKDQKALFLKNGMENLLLTFIWVLPVGYIYLNNAAYLKVDFLQEQTIAYYTTLITEIKGTEGYQDEMPVVYVGERNLKDDSLTTMPFFNDIKITGYEEDLTAFINDYAWRVFVGRHCGYFPNEIMDRSPYEQMPEVQEMPCYPDKGSIKVVNETVVVKLSE